MFKNGENLDKNASIYALIKHMKKFGITHIDVEEINAGEKRSGGLTIDAGDLTGLEGFNPRYLGRKSVNGKASQGQPSTCGVLAACGIYVPPKIIEHADTVTDERIINARYGVSLSRNFNWETQGQKLFDFANKQRDDGTYLMDATLTDEELEEWGLEELCRKREEDIKRDTEAISKNIYYFTDENGQERKVCIVDYATNCGSFISYSLGCDYYISVCDRENCPWYDSENTTDSSMNEPMVSFTICANPKKGDGKIPKSVLKYFEDLRDSGENESIKVISTQGREIKNNPFIKPDKTMVVLGGYKVTDIYIALKDPSQVDEEYGITQYMIDELSDLMGARVLQKDKKDEFIRTSIEGWKNEDAQNVANEILGDSLEPIKLSGVEEIGRAFIEDNTRINSHERGE